jgi:hypothetical protein
MGSLIRRKPTKKITASEAARLLGFKSSKSVVKRAKQGHFRMIPGEETALSRGLDQRSNA